jgi:LytS/YehU family sensor histidine kinase
LQQIESFKYNTQLNNLRAQINPHFLFNTLNSIYSVTIKKAPEAADMVEKLAEMMRFTLKESQSDFVSLTKEITYVQNYIELQKMRFDKNVQIHFDVHGEIKPFKIAPLILIPFVENAFKYGVNSEEDSSISIQIIMQGSEMTVEIHNNKVQIDQTMIEKNGVGIENTLKRLDLIYPNQHKCSINETEQEFTVILQIRLT